jgi:hypothetical protein
MSTAILNKVRFLSSDSKALDLSDGGAHMKSLNVTGTTTAKDMNITGDLHVSGKTFTVTSEDTAIKDQNLNLNYRTQDTGNELAEQKTGLVMINKVHDSQYQYTSNTLTGQVWNRPPGSVSQDELDGVRELKANQVIQIQENSTGTGFVVWGLLKIASVTTGVDGSQTITFDTTDKQFRVDGSFGSSGDPTHQLTADKLKFKAVDVSMLFSNIEGMFFAQSHHGDGVLSAPTSFVDNENSAFAQDEHTSGPISSLRDHKFNGTTEFDGNVDVQSIDAQLLQVSTLVYEPQIYEHTTGADAYEEATARPFNRIKTNSPGTGFSYTLLDGNIGEVRTYVLDSDMTSGNGEPVTLLCNDRRIDGLSVGSTGINLQNKQDKLQLHAYGSGFRMEGDVSLNDVNTKLNISPHVAAKKEYLGALVNNKVFQLTGSNAGAEYEDGSGNPLIFQIDAVTGDLVLSYDGGASFSAGTLANGVLMGEEPIWMVV